MPEGTHTKADSQLLVQGNLAAINDTITLTRFLTWGVVGLQITGTFVGTVTFEGTIDGATWVATALIPIGGGAAVTTATAPGIFANTSNALAGIRCRLSATTSGTAVATIRSFPSQY